LKTLVVTMLLTLSASIGLASGGSNGGGGDYTENLVNDIRIDILSWIAKGGAKKLNLTLPYQTYVEQMNAVLAQHAVIIGSISTLEELNNKDPDLSLVINGQPKTCRGSVWKKDSRYHILCNIERFGTTPENERYSLVHHEYAGLAGVEKNLGASSDYDISRQLTGFLEKVEVLRLSLKQTKRAANPDGCVDQGNMVCVDHDRLFPAQEFILKTAITLSTLRPTFFVNGSALQMNHVREHQGEIYCGIQFSTRKVDGVWEQIVPNSLEIVNGHIRIPATPEPFLVSDLSWYTSDIHFRSSVQNSEIGLAITCGRVEGTELIEAKGTSRADLLSALNGIFEEAP
jgi:hypothetical protein